MYGQIASGYTSRLSSMIPPSSCCVTTNTSPIIRCSRLMRVYRQMPSVILRPRNAPRTSSGSSEIIVRSLRMISCTFPEPSRHILYCRRLNAFMFPVFESRYSRTFPVMMSSFIACTSWWYELFRKMRRNAVFSSSANPLARSADSAPIASASWAASPVLSMRKNGWLAGNRIRASLAASVFTYTAPTLW